MISRQNTYVSTELNSNWEIYTSGQTEPLWFKDIRHPIKFNKLSKNVTVDVAIVGGGIAGITSAYLLSSSGKDVAILDDGCIGSGETGRTTAHITHALDDRYYDIERIHGKKGAKLAAESHTAAIDMIESIVTSESIDCDFERLDGYLFLDPTDNEKSLQNELEATHRAGILRTERGISPPLQSFNNIPCIRFPNQAQFQPLKYLAGLAQAIARSGGLVFTETHAQEVTATGIKTTSGYRIRAKKIVVATNAPIIDKISKIYDKQNAYRTYVIAAQIKKGAVPKALYWDTGNHNAKNLVPPYHYVRIQKLKDDENYDLLIVGGEDHGTGNADDMDRRYDALNSWARKYFPTEDIVYRWSGQVLEPKDSMAFIGRNPRDRRKNIFIATGDSGNGMTHGTIAGMLLTDLILGKKKKKKNRWVDLYNPSRKVKSRLRGTRSGSDDDDDGDDGGRSSSTPKKIEMEQALQKAAGLARGQGMIVEIKKRDPHAFTRMIVAR